VNKRDNIKLIKRDFISIVEGREKETGYGIELYRCSDDDEKNNKKRYK
jgi:hypothetical protein